MGIDDINLSEESSKSDLKDALERCDKVLKNPYGYPTEDYNKAQKIIKQAEAIRGGRPDEDWRH